MEPTPQSWLERAYDWNLAMLPGLFFFLAAFEPLREELGYWLALVITLAAALALTLIVSLPSIPLKKRRVARDAEQGIFECAHREPGSSLKDKWALGYAKAEPGRLLFQAKTGTIGPLVGRVETYSGLRVLSPPAKSPWSVFPRGRVITLSTDKGTVELAATPSGLSLLTKLSLDHGS